MRFGRGCARMLSFSFFPYFEGWSEFLSGGSEDDAADDIFFLRQRLLFILFPTQAALEWATVGFGIAVGFVEGAGLEVGLAGAEQAVEGVGRLRGDAAVVERAHDQKTVGLDGGAVLGIEERQGAVQVVELRRHDGAGHGAPDDAVMTAIWASGDGRLRAAAPGGQKIAAEFVHICSLSLLLGR